MNETFTNNVHQARKWFKKLIDFSSFRNGNHLSSATVSYAKLNKDFHTFQFSFS